MVHVIVTAIFVSLGTIGIINILGTIRGGRRISQSAAQIYKKTYDNLNGKGLVIFHFPREGKEMVIIRHHQEGNYTGHASLVIDGETEELEQFWFDHMRGLRPGPDGKPHSGIAIL